MGVGKRETSPHRTGPDVLSLPTSSHAAIRAPADRKPIGVRYLLDTQGVAPLLLGEPSGVAQWGCVGAELLGPLVTDRVELDQLLTGADLHALADHRDADVSADPLVPGAVGGAGKGDRPTESTTRITSAPSPGSCGRFEEGARRPRMMTGSTGR